MDRYLPHDLLWTACVDWLPADAPDWAVKVLQQGQPVVVRRANGVPGQVAVGLRGSNREQRYASWIPASSVLHRLSPEQLAAHPLGERRWPALQALQQLKPVLEATGLVWGVSGSAGYELACGVAALHQHSDLDLIVRTPVPMSRPAARQLLERLQTPLCRIDVQLQTPGGAVALGEWAGDARQVLLKSSAGACLVADPWLVSERLA
ncbi:malonate decarboxylase holo-ACP synthase [Pseudomonas sp. GD03860]|uniref:malonate decarboxylase holo-ACP synthase n=1 Tax=Pseudomonas TaxID=286 RepID=UPI002363B488|nr:MULTISPECIES: malonate decarboxylase holo-ACP synthase [Pseudomonas]MDD2058488.1 malonate decarboxylase holo-ACP synthase [Pseudomonas putida]MDH0640840.1 malonate decarboxylase holo-ACP synthase [Pseudomonas sp. GD03860]